MNQRRWRDLSPRSRGNIAFAAGVQLTLAAVAWTDLAVRPASEIRGPKRMWAWVIAINFLGPLAYLSFGRRPMNPAAYEPSTKE
ncbi:PLD nuclease N-terminal domain-containing protein [Amycolatopsis sp. NPDC059657]|uniref:PLD nuclease N-terminal domain-containing protein n=1 Tax=Amycolatopsis sp. NPDC059657 TaxID=3346899 RepID=UPI00366F2C4E